MITDDRPIALITGATAGIGQALAYELSKTHLLILVGRKDPNADQLPKGGPEGAAYIQTDLQDVFQAVTDITVFLEQHGVVALNNLIHCAGVGFYRDAGDETSQQISQTIDVNLLFPSLLTHKLTPLLRAAQSQKVKGQVTFIGSVAHRGAANMPTYAASKAGLHGLARSLRSEWRDEINVQVIHPGPTSTKMHQKAGYRPGKEAALFVPVEQMARDIAGLIKIGKSPVTIFLWAKLKSLFPGSRP